MDHCDACHYVYAEVTAHDIPTRLAAFGPRYRAVLCPSDPTPGWDTVLRTRPAAEVWSALEYACHLRDVFLMQRERLYLALVEDLPRFATMHREHRVTLARYNAQDPAEVADQLTLAARLIGQAFGTLDKAQLARRCIYNYPTPTEHSLLWVGQHAIHEGEHHWQDITTGLTHLCPGWRA